MARNDNKDARGKPRVQTHNTEPSQTIQSDAHLADINNILASFAVGGQEMLRETDLLFKDVSEFTDFKDLMDQNLEAERHFMSLPSKVREVFDHDLAVFLDSAHDKDKRDELVKRGLLDPVAEDPPTKVEKTSEKGTEASTEKVGGSSEEPSK